MHHALLPTFCTTEISVVVAAWEASGEGPRFGMASATAPDMAPLMIIDKHMERACGTAAGTGDEGEHGVGDRTRHAWPCS